MLTPEQALVIVVVSAGSAAVATPIVMRVARGLGVVDQPNERKVSRRANMPLMGGLAVALGTFMGLAVAILAGALEASPGAGFEGFVIGGSILIAVGAWDDRWGLSASPKLIVQLLAASVAVFYGFRIDEFREPISGLEFELPLWLSWTVTILWIVLVTNAMNFIDGLDGEATGIAAIIAVTMVLICWQGNQFAGVILGTALLGALLGFLPFNFPPARIFLGDTGALFIGYSLSLLALEGYLGGHRKAALFTFAVPLMTLAVPLLDILLSVLRRLRSHRAPWVADNLHMHHRLLASEGSQRRAVLSLYFVTTCFCVIAVSFSRLQGYLALIFFGAVVVLTFRLLSNLGALSIDALPSLDQKSSGDDPQPRDAEKTKGDLQ